MAICDGGGVEGRKQENVAEKKMAICDGGGVESRIHEYVTEKQPLRYVMVAGLKVAYISTWQKNNNGDM
ncbi:hypothetical protein DPMN_161387 [Dreissena polymorpha]|uniref:Uncharacterized protein n=1 Tax=Dreissena polymorpha TaxID=45954 RepID=A0A9D4EPV9_DREPO|nr:hypothetical protein DPMN_161387 [Dreissena polymorpha]